MTYGKPVDALRQPRLWGPMMAHVWLSPTDTHCHRKTWGYLQDTLTKRTQATSWSSFGQLRLTASESLWWPLAACFVRIEASPWVSYALLRTMPPPSSHADAFSKAVFEDPCCLLGVFHYVTHITSVDSVEPFRQGSMFVPTMPLGWLSPPELHGIRQAWGCLHAMHRLKECRNVEGYILRQKKKFHIGFGPMFRSLG